MSWKIGDKINTPHGEGIVSSFERHSRIVRVGVILDKNNFDNPVNFYFQDELSLQGHFRCKACKNQYSIEDSLDFVDQECIPCRSQREFTLFERYLNHELTKFNIKNRTEYSTNSFFDACFCEKIKSSLLKEFPTLQIVFNHINDQVEMLKEDDNFENEEDHMQEPDYYFCMCCGCETAGRAYDCPRCMGPMGEGFF
ncbi:hypothetical protein [Leptospira noguchii]|uniref:Uncharacterized protein n=1 Tax=Leptospira noguchii TaxID=28182 RepID=M6VFS9_9LEPT|nr:hypothetical protein [Leptospira noguchii]EMO53901.1 hypothetical protein LEP1GSC172_3301 [Leptospira noguchii]